MLVFNHCTFFLIILFTLPQGACVFADRDILGVSVIISYLT